MNNNNQKKQFKFKCWYLSKKVGWVIFEKDFSSEAEATEYCEAKTDFKGSSIVEMIEDPEIEKALLDKELKDITLEEMITIHQYMKETGKSCSKCPLLNLNIDCQAIIQDLIEAIVEDKIKRGGK